MIITLCGSARFEDHYKAWSEALTLAGHIVFSISVYPSDKGFEKGWYTDEQKTVLDLVHLSKIDASDAILILNVCAYVGESTLKEIQWAKMKGKSIYVLESWGVGCGIGSHHTEEARDYKTQLGVGVNYVSPIDTAGYTYPYYLLNGDSELISAVGSIKPK